MSRILVLISAATLLTAAAVCGAGVAKGGPTMPLKLTSSAFSAGGTIPKKHTCDGADVSPPLAWSDAPSAAQSFALIADDPDAPVGTWVHWVLFDIPGDRKSTRLNSSHLVISYAVFCLKKKKTKMHLPHAITWDSVLSPRKQQRQRSRPAFPRTSTH